jgi:DNA polymerase-3 subunit alpha (Gram-positive type)
MARAGRYSNAVIKNKYFDVMRYADKFKDKLEIDGRGCSLKTLSEKLDIENPRAHRALADAITTARLYLKLREMDDNKSGMYSESMDDFLSDIDNW